MGWDLIRKAIFFFLKPYVHYSPSKFDNYMSSVHIRAFKNHDSTLILVKKETVLG